MLDRYAQWTNVVISMQMLGFLMVLDNMCQLSPYTKKERTEKRLEETRNKKNIIKKEKKGRKENRKKKKPSKTK